MSEFSSSTYLNTEITFFQINHPVLDEYIFVSTFPESAQFSYFILCIVIASSKTNDILAGIQTNRWIRIKDNPDL
uniref:Ovule protein n=1 Tax=Ditylenchus dipsaci TaxID=166011 RepID=A0A915EE19_9BILA